MKQFHIISVGNSLLSNFKKKREDIKDIPFSDEEKWEELYRNPVFMNDIYEFLYQNPKRHSAELNSFLNFLETKGAEEVNVYLIGTNTVSNQICKDTIERYLKEKGYKMGNSQEFSGYFFERHNYDERYARKEFTRNIGAIIDAIIYIARKKQEEGFEVYVNPTGGLKPHVVAAAVSGFLTGCGVYYIHEEFKKVIEFPRLFYLPKGEEVKLLKLLSDRVIRRGKELENLISKYHNEIERLNVYGLVFLDKDTLGEDKLQITERGILFYNFIKKEVK